MARSRRRRADLLSAVIVPLLLLAGALTVKAVDPGPLESLRLAVFDSYQRIRPRSYVPAPVRIVDIDDASLAALGQWPWPRNLLADLVNRLADAGAAAIAFDVVFSEPDRSSPSGMATAFAAVLPAGVEAGALLASLPDHDRAFAEAFARLPVVTGFALNRGPLSRAPAEPWAIAQAGNDPRPTLHGFSGAVVNLPLIEQAARGNGSINALPDRDGVIRRIPLLLRLGDEIVPSLTAEALRVVQGAGTYIVKAAGAQGVESFGAASGVSAVKIGVLELSTDPSAALWLYSTGPRPERFVSAAAVLNGTANPTLIAGHVVLIGTSAAGLHDLRASPLNPAGPGVELHAELLEQVMAGVSLNRPDWAAGTEFTFTLILGLVLVFLLHRLGAVLCALVAGLALASAFAASWFAFSAAGLLFDPVLPSIVVVAVLLAALMTGYFRTEADRARIRNAFSHYLAPALVDRLAADPTSLQLGGETRDLTVMFCDVRDFTSLSESRTPQQITSLINRFLTPMTAEILERGGTIDKYIGDAIMAFWNAPLDTPGHAERACATALAMRTALQALNAALAREAEPGAAPAELRFGVGLNTGPCLVGNVGSTQRFAYSALGDAVNLASRLEGQTKAYGVDLLLSEMTRSAAGALATIELDLLRVKGRTQPVAIHALVGDEALANTAPFAALADGHARMLAAFRERRWQDAGASLPDATAYEAFGLGRVHTLYAARIEVFAREEPAAGWDGVVDAETK